MGHSPSTFLKFKIINNKQYANEQLQKAESLDYYLSECYDDKSNSYARRKMTYAPNILSDAEIEYYTVNLDNLKSNIPKRLQMDLEEIQIIQLMPSADGGMPHTRPDNIICYPDITQLLTFSTLIHELWHIHQRRFKDIWTKVFNRLDWKEWNNTLPLHLENNRRFNPDTIDSPLWIFKNTWIPVPIFNDISTPKVNDTTIWFYNNESNYHSKNIPDEMQTMFPDLPPSAYEHPRELTAYMLSTPNTQKTSPGYAHLIDAIGQISVLFNKF